MAQQIVGTTAHVLELAEVICSVLLDVQRRILHSTPDRFFVLICVVFVDIIYASAFRGSTTPHVRRILPLRLLIFDLVLLLRFLETLPVDEVGYLWREYERIRLTGELNHRHEFFVLKEMSKIDVEEVTLLNIDHDIVWVPIT